MSVCEADGAHCRSRVCAPSGYTAESRASWRNWLSETSPERTRFHCDARSAPMRCILGVVPMSPVASVADNIAAVRDRIIAAASRVNRDPSCVTLMAVSKMVPADRVLLAYQAGVMDLGENYVQEARAKAQLLPEAVRWHFIGHLQTNKARQVAGRFALVHSVDRMELAIELGKRAVAQGVTQDVLVEVKLDEAATKFGVDPVAALDLVGQCTGIEGLAVRGLMGMAPYSDDPQASRPHFARLKQLFDQLPAENRIVLSMGMSGDFEVAVEEGSTLVRVGTAIFGARPAALQGEAEKK